MNDVTEGEVGRVDQDACFLACFADRSLDHRFTCLQVPAGRAQLTVGVAGARPFQQEDRSVGAAQEDVDVHDGAVAIRRKGPFWPAVPLGRAEIVVRSHSRRA
jgi:hypothetical protein